MKRNQTMMQFFEWHIDHDGTHWNALQEVAPQLESKGITAIWIPPVTKGLSVHDTGYGAYDLYDLGEFDQKGSVRTKYGTKEELMNAISACHEHGLVVYIDLVMNHKAGADEKETFQVVEVDANNRTQEISTPFDIEGWTKFTFPGRHEHYSSFQWNFEHFNGTDYDARTERVGIFRILGDHKHWNDQVDHELGNYDYLMFADIDYNHPQVTSEMITWGKWLATTLSCNGYRLDAIKHINYEFIKQFAQQMVQERGDDFYIVGEFWNPDLAECQQFLDTIDYAIDLFDVSLHYRFQAASQAGRDFDLRTIFDHTLVQSHPMNAVTFVDNHDSQPNQALESWVQDAFKPCAYALILLRKDGFPVIFYGDYYGIGGDNPLDGKQSIIDPLLYVRYHKAYGEQHDYFDHPNTIGWVRLGIPEITASGCAVVISNGDPGEKRMSVGEQRAGEVWIDYTRNRQDNITIERDGYATFPVHSGSISVWINSEQDTL
ncbi:alpha-amylase [Paenibacillus sp. CMAA1364]